MRVDVRPGASRFVTRTDWIVSRHSFSYGPHYDPDNIRFGALIAHNDDLLQPGGGFDAHPHRDVEIVTFLIDGALAHRDDHGAAVVLRPGFVQRLSTGRGVVHSEVNAYDGTTRYLQMWLSPDVDGPADYEVAEARPGAGAFGLIASGSAPAPLALRQSDAALLAARLRRGQSAMPPRADLAHLYVADGAVLVGEVTLGAGDAARVTGATGLEVVAAAESLVLVWLFGLDLAGPNLAGPDFAD